MSTEIQKQLKQMHDPFANTTTQPKIPDGMVDHTLGLAFDRVGEMVVAANQTAELLLFPGMNGVLQMINVTDSSASVTTGRISGDSGSQYAVAGLKGANAYTFAGYTNNTTSFDALELGGFSKWRIVSEGLRLKLLSSQDNDDGWFEACRVKVQKKPEDWVITYRDTETDVTNNSDNYAIMPMQLIANNYGEDADLANQPSYSTGLLRDLHRVQFNLNPQQNTQFFEDVEKDIQISASELGSGSLLSAPFEVKAPDPGTAVSALYDDAYNTHFDNHFDMIYIRVHSGGNGSKLHYHVAANHEVVFDPKEREAKYMTKCHSIGDGAISLHQQARRANSNAVSLIG